MCSRYPSCVHEGPLVEPIEGLTQHCTTALPNHTCLYLRLGCRGCTFRQHGASLTFNPIVATMLYKLFTELHTPDVVERLREAIALAQQALEHTEGNTPE